MGATKRTGVDGAIALLRTLAENNGDISTADALAATGVPRASLHRISAILSGYDLVDTSRGKLRGGRITPHISQMISPRPLASSLWRNRRTVEVRSPEIRVEEPWRALTLSPAPALRRKPRFNIGFSNASLNNPWRTALVHTIEYACSRLSDTVEYLAIRHADDDTGRQAEHIVELANEGIDGLLISAAGSEDVVQALAYAQSRGVAIVMVDRRPSGRVHHLSFVASSNGFIGRTTARWLAEKIDAQGRVVMLPGLQCAEPARKRYAAACAVLLGYPDIELAKTTWTGWTPAIAYRTVSKMLAKGEHIDAVWCDSGLQGVGSLQAFIDAGFRPGEIPPHTGGDLNRAYKLALNHKVQLAAVDYPPSMGLVAVETLMAALQGKWVLKHIDVPSEIIVTKGGATQSVQPTIWVEDHVRWDLPDQLVLQAGIGPAYNPVSFRIRYPGNNYNRSAAHLAKVMAS